jgi:hypothetical protein
MRSPRTALVLGAILALGQRSLQHVRQHRLSHQRLPTHSLHRQTTNPTCQNPKEKLTDMQIESRLYSRAMSLLRRRDLHTGDLGGPDPRVRELVLDAVEDDVDCAGEQARLLRRSLNRVYSTGSSDQEKKSAETGVKNAQVFPPLVAPYEKSNPLLPPNKSFTSGSAVSRNNSAWDTVCSNTFVKWYRSEWDGVPERTIAVGEITVRHERSWGGAALPWTGGLMRTYACA